MTTIGDRAASITIAEALADARAAGLDRTDAMLLLGHHLQRPRGWLIAHDDSPVPDAALVEIDPLETVMPQALTPAWLVRWLSSARR